MLTLDGGGGGPAGLKCRHQRLITQPADRAAQFIGGDAGLVSWRVVVSELLASSRVSGTMCRANPHLATRRSRRSSSLLTFPDIVKCN